MPDEVTTTETATAAPVETSTPAAEVAKTFTQDQVNAIVQERLAKDRAARPAATAAATKPTSAPVAAAPASPSVDDLNAKLTELTQRLEFKDRVAGRTLDADQSEVLFQVFKANPTGFDKAVAVFGINTTPPPAAPAATTAPTTEALKPPAAAPAAPSAHALPTANGVVDLFNLQPAQLASLGPQGVRENLDKLWAQGNQMSGAPARPKPPTQR